MNEKDMTMIYIGIVVAVIVLVGSAVFEGEKAAGGLKSFTVVVTTSDETIFEKTEYLNEGESKEYPVSVEQENLISIEFILTWSDDNPGLLDGSNDEFSLDVKSDWGNDSTSSTSESITIKFELNKVPETGDYKGQSEDDVKESLSTTNGTGLYSVTVTCENAGDRDPTPLGQDNGNNFTLKVIITYYQVKVSESPAPGK